MDTKSLSISEQVHKNYNTLSKVIIQHLFGEGYLSPRGEHGTVELARRAAPREHSRVLDVGSGLGGPAIWLAANIGCSVTGLDLVASNVDTAKALAAARGVGHLACFQQGDATDLPFEADSFSMVWGQDAWCHAPDRDAVIAECARVLRPGGEIAFADWVLIGEDDDFYRQCVLPAMSCLSYETVEGYTDLLERHGFVDIETEDRYADYASHFENAMQTLEQSEAWITETIWVTSVRHRRRKEWLCEHRFRQQADRWCALLRSQTELIN